MNIRINGKSERVEKVSSLAELITHKHLSPERIVVEHNLKILPREDWVNTVLREDDQIEIVSFVQGG